MNMKSSSPLLSLSLLLLLLLSLQHHINAYKNISEFHEKDIPNAKREDCLDKLHEIGLSYNWIQQGTPRTATTLQFMILNAFAWKICGVGNVITGFYGNEKRSPLVWKKSRMAMANGNNRISVTKTHKPESIGEVLMVEGRKNITLFRTAKEKGEAVHTYQGVEVRYTQLVSDLSRGIRYQVQQYSRMFGFRDNETDQITEWAELYDKSRMCCGSQMSASWRDALINNKKDNKPLSELKAGTHFCQQLNMKDVETRMAEIEKEAYGTQLVNIGHCNCSIEMTIKDHLEFNAPQYKKCMGYLENLSQRSYEMDTFDITPYR